MELNKKKPAYQCLEFTVLKAAWSLINYEKLSHSKKEKKKKEKKSWWSQTSQSVN